MDHKNRVLKSINLPGDNICIDILSAQIILMVLMSFAVIPKMDEVGSVLDTKAR